MRQWSSQANNVIFVLFISYLKMLPVSRIFSFAMAFRFTHCNIFTMFLTIATSRKTYKTKYKYQGHFLFRYYFSFSDLSGKVVLPLLYIRSFISLFVSVFIVAIRLLNYTVCFTVFESIEPLLGKLSNRRLIKKHTPYFPIIFSSTFFFIVPANFFLMTNG